MKSIYKKGALFAAAALMAFGLSGCGGDSGNASKGPKDTLTVGVRTSQTASNRPTTTSAGRSCVTASVNVSFTSMTR